MNEGEKVIRFVPKNIFGGYDNYVTVTKGEGESLSVSIVGKQCFLDFTGMETWMFFEWMERRRFEELSSFLLSHGFMIA